MMINSHSLSEFGSLIKDEISDQMESLWRLDKFEIEEEIQSPEYLCMWESVVADQLKEGDFMVSSPVRKPLPTPSPTHQNNCNSNNYVDQLVAQAEAMQTGNGLSLGLSPVLHNHKVLNSDYYCMQVVEESLSLPPLVFLDDLDNDDDDHFGTANSNSIPNGSEVEIISSSEVEFFYLSTTVPELQQYYLPTMPISPGTQDINDADIYQMSSSTESAPLIHQSQPQWQQENQLPQLQQQESSISHPTNQQLQINMNSSLISIGPEQEEDRELGVVHFLLACAEAVAKEDYTSAGRYLHHLNGVVSPLGDSMQRVASCFAQALDARVVAAAAALSKPLLDPFPPPTNSHETLNICYQFLYQACPYIKFAHFTANQAIFEAFQAQHRVHIIDLDILQGYQWPAFMQALAARPGGAPFLRITGIGPSPESVSETGRCLKELARSFHIPFEFHAVAVQHLQDLKPHMFDTRVGEALAVNSVNRLHRVPARFLGNLLGMIRDQAPNIVTVVEQEASHNGAHFLGRFLEALHYYSAIFDSLEAAFPRDSEQRMKVEQYIFGAEIRNIVAAEGPERITRHEKLGRWRKIMEGKGFEGVPLSQNAVNQSKMLLGLYRCVGYRLTEDKGCLILGWQDRPILAASAWRY